MATVVKKTISLSRELAEEAERIAREEGRSLSAVFQEGIRLARARRLRGELRELQSTWGVRARELGILTEEDLDRLLDS